MHLLHLIRICDPELMGLIGFEELAHLLVQPFANGVGKGWIDRL